MRATALLCLALCGCVPAISDYQAPAGMVSTQQRDFAECRIKARQTSGEFIGGLEKLAAIRGTLNDCMTAKGYVRN